MSSLLASWTLLDATVAAGLTVAGLGLAAAAAALTGRARRRAMTAGSRLVTIAVPTTVDTGSAAAWWANLAGILTPSPWRRLRHGRPHLVWEYLWTGRQLQIRVWLPGTVPAGTVEAAIRGAWPGAATTTAPATPPIPDTARVQTGGHLLPAGNLLPIRTDHDADPLRALIAAAGQLRTGEHACVQILARPARPHRVARARRAAQARTGHPGPTPAGWLLAELASLFLSGRASTRPSTATAGRDPSRDRDHRAAQDKLAQPLWDTAVRYAVATGNTRNHTPAETTALRARVRGVADAVASSFAVYTGPNRLTRRLRLPHPSAAVAARRLGRGFLTATGELAALAALPQDLAVPGLDRARARAMPAPVSVATGGRGATALGDAQVGGHPVALKVEDGRYHVHMVGATGSGKSTLLTHMIVANVQAGRGTVVVDPHGDLVLDILDRLPASVGDRLVLFDPDQPNPPALNPLEGDDHDLVVDNLVSIFGNIFAKAWGPRMDDVMRVSCLTLLRHANVTLQQIPPLLNSARFRAAMTADLDDPAGLGGFWQWYDEMNPGLRAQVIGPVLARLRAFLLRDFVNRTLRHPTSSFDMTRVLDGGVLLARLPKGVLGEDTSRLLGSLILAKVWQAATARAAVPADQRRDCMVVLDECQNFLTLASSLDTVLAEARKYRLKMILAHQDLAQFPRDLLAAVSANARNKVYFACSPEDAHILARHTTPELTGEDLARLDAYTAAARLMVDGRQTAAFTLRTRPPRPPVGESVALRQAAARSVLVQPPAAIADLARRLANPLPKPR